MGDEANRVVVWNLTTKNIEGRLSGVTVATPCETSCLYRNSVLRCGREHGRCGANVGCAES